jgi:hypothetical protein
MNVNTRQDDTGVVKGNFRQCTLVRECENGVSTTVSLIPEKYAKVGRGLELCSDGQWDHWMVLKVSPNLTVDPVDARILIKSHRRATGDSMKRTAPTKKED